MLGNVQAPPARTHALVCNARDVPSVMFFGACVCVSFNIIKCEYNVYVYLYMHAFYIHTYICIVPTDMYHIYY